jgi:hypothetical protein
MEVWPRAVWFASGPWVFLIKVIESFLSCIRSRQMKRLIITTLCLAMLLITVAPGETVHNLLQQNNRTWAPFDLSVIPEILRSNANVFFVDSEATRAADQADGVHGETPDTPFATLDYAIGKSTAGKNNIIVVMPYHDESIAAAGVDIDVSGITILGLGYGPARPKFTFTATSSTFICGSSGDGATIQNITFEAGISAVVAGVVVEDSCDNLTLIDCEWLDAATAAYEFNTAVDVSVDANDLAFVRCRWTSSAAAGAITCIDIGDGAVDGLLIQDCVMYGDYSTACIFSDQALTRVLIDNCVMYNANSDEYGPELQGTSNLGIMTNCKIYTSGNYYDLGGIAPMACLTATIGDLTTDAWTWDLATNNLDHLAKTTTGVAADGDLSNHVVDATILSHLMTKGADTSDYQASTDSLEAIGEAVAAILTDTGTTLNGLIVDANTNVTSILEDTGTTLPASISDVNDQVTLILADTAQMQQSSPLCVTKALATITNGNNNLFTIAGGPIKVLELVGYVTAEIEAKSCLINYNMDPTNPATDTPFGTDGTALEINADAIGTLYTWDGVVATDLTATTNGVALGLAAESGIILPTGSLELAAVVDTSATGTITFYLRYLPLAPGVTVVAQ